MIYKEYINADKIKIEPFSLEFGSVQSCDIHFVVRIGNSKIESDISDWSTNFDLIRDQLETLTFYMMSSDVKLCFEGDPTIFHFEWIHTSRKELIDENEHPCKRDLLLYVEIRPNSFTKPPIISGVCELKETIRQMYEALLQLGLSFASTSAEECKEWDYSNGMNIYNTLKSGIVEKFLIANDEEPEVVKRQTIVKHIITISQSKGLTITSENEVLNQEQPNIDDEISIPYFGSLKLKGISAWQNKYREDNYDWTQGDVQGLTFARQIRANMPEEYDIWYQIMMDKKHSYYNRNMASIDGYWDVTPKIKNRIS